MTYGEVLQLPIGAFWELVKNVDRIRAEEDRRLFGAVASAFGGNAREYLDSLEKEQGMVATGSDSFGYDTDGIMRLKNLMGGR
jgi:hypothetical protein